MWIEEKTTKNGGKSFVYYERYTDPQTGKTRRVSVSLASNTRAAVKQATAMLQTKIADRLSAVSLDERRLDDAIREWLEFRAVAVKPSTLYGLKNQLKALTRALPADILISRVNLAAVQNVITTMQARKMSRAYVVKILGTARQLFKYAVKMRYIDRADWLDGVEVQHQEKTREDVARLPTHPHLDATGGGCPRARCHGARRTRHDADDARNIRAHFQGRALGCRRQA